MKLWKRIRQFYRRRQLELDLADEIRIHREMAESALRAAGSTPEDARRDAARTFGSSALTLEDSRAVWRWAWLDAFVQDLRGASRVLHHSPAFTLAAVFSLAAGIGASTAVFSIADTVFLRPLPYRDPGRLAWIAVQFHAMGGEFLTSPDYVAWRRDNRTFEHLAATSSHPGGAMLLSGSAGLPSGPIEIHAARVSFNFLSAFAIAPALGRSFTAEEELPNGPKAVLLTDALWRGRFHARQDIAGRIVTLDGDSYTIAGVLPRSFVFPMDVKVDLLTTLPVSPTSSHRDRGMAIWAVYGRLKPGVTWAQARADLETQLAASRADLPRLFRAENTLVFQPLQQHRVADAGMLLPVLAGAAGCLLLIACANLANLLLARWSSRSRELAVRAAIGAGRGRIVRQLFTETLLLTAAGWAAAMLFVDLALRGFVYFAAGELPRLAEVTADTRVFAIALLVSLATTMLFGGLPALCAGRVDIQSVLQRAGRGAAAGGYRTLRRVLVSAEIALSIVLLSGAALLLQTLWRLQNTHLGFQPQHAIAVTIPVRAEKLDRPRREALAGQIRDDLERLPGTETAALTGCTPLSAGGSSSTFARSDRPLPEPFHRGDSIGICAVGPGYFQAAGAPLVRGRYLTAEDYRPNVHVAVLNEAAARSYFPGEDPLGKRIGGLGSSPWRTVTGVVADSRNLGLSQPAMPEMFINDLYDPDMQAGSDLLFLVRTAATEQAFAAAFRAQLRARRPTLFAKFQTLDEAIGEMTASPRFNTVLLSSFAAAAFLMAMAGVYGVLAFSVAQRTQEIGIRLALGAQPRTVLAMVLREGALLALGGALAGVAGALTLTRYLKSLLYGITASDPATYAAVVAAIAAAAFLASCLPARRAASVDPIAALRHE